LLLPLFTITMPNVTAGGIFFPRGHCNLIVCPIPPSFLYIDILLKYLLLGVMLVNKFQSIYINEILNRWAVYNYATIIIKRHQLTRELS
jgi:hypothetical protein